MRPYLYNLCFESILKNCVCDFDFFGGVVVDSALRERLNKIMASDYFTTSPKMKAPVEVAAEREVKIRERREMREKR